MRIAKYLNTTKEEVESKKFNIWIGVSLGNRYFTKENIEKYIRWALEHTKEDVAVVIPDRLHAINLEVLKGRSKLSAFRKAFQMGDAKAKEVAGIIATLPENQREHVHIARWSAVTDTKYTDYRTEILFEEFRKRDDFYRHVMEIVTENFKNHPKPLTDVDREKLAEYVLYEIPFMLNGVKHNGKTYLLMPYPGLDTFDYLMLGLQDGTLFDELAKKLKVTDKISLLEAYVD
ncbi:tRNA-dependent cyclodipeptide synthase [Candidatus Parcubacteria bacterium]|nr:tRNA-dependent cyclodipeptide synthase [Candidatus Parcubacteria bacterium]